MSTASNTGTVTFRIDSILKDRLRQKSQQRNPSLSANFCASWFARASRIRQRIGRLDAARMQAGKAALMRFLGIDG